MTTLVFDWQAFSEYLKEYAEGTGITAQEIADGSGAHLSVCLGLYDGTIQNPPINDFLAIVAYVFEDDHSEFLKVSR